MRWLTAGESHGPSLTAILEGMPAGVEVTTDDVRAALAHLPEAVAALDEAGAFRAD